MSIKDYVLPALVCGRCGVEMKYTGFDSYMCPDCGVDYSCDFIADLLLFSCELAHNGADDDKVVVEKAKLDEINAAIEKVVKGKHLRQVWI